MRKKSGNSLPALSISIISYYHKNSRLYFSSPVIYNAIRGDNMPYDFFVSPITYKPLEVTGNKLKNLEESYRIISGVPVLLPKEYSASWHRELVEVILWEYPEEIKMMYSEIDWKTSPVPVYIEYLKRLLYDKQGIEAAFERYSNQNTDKWIIEKSKTVTLGQRLEFNEFARKSTGKKRTETKIDAKGIFTVYPYFGKAVNGNSPETIVELGTGAGGGTASIALEMREKTALFTVDIGFECLGNAVGIRKYQKKNIMPVCANFWYLPFADNTVDSVCTFNGFDESREIDRTIAQVSRILKTGGKFTVVSRKNAFMRQSAVLEPFGFTEEEAVEFLKKCRLYSDVDYLTEICEKNNLKLKSRKEFERNEKLTSVLSVFEKE